MLFFEQILLLVNKFPKMGNAYVRKKLYLCAQIRINPKV